jgi:hypothetical protein
MPYLLQDKVQERHLSRFFWGVNQSLTIARMACADAISVLEVLCRHRRKRGPPHAVALGVFRDMLAIPARRSQPRAMRKIFSTIFPRLPLQEDQPGRLREATAQSREVC